MVDLKFRCYKDRFEGWLNLDDFVHDILPARVLQFRWVVTVFAFGNRCYFTLHRTAIYTTYPSPSTTPYLLSSTSSTHCCASFLLAGHKPW